MPGKLESRIERDAWTRARDLMGVTSSKIVTPGETGWPDRLFWLPTGHPVLIEFKRPGEAPRPKQEHVHALLRDLGYPVYVCDSAIVALLIIRAGLIKRGIRCEWNGE